MKLRVGVVGATGRTGSIVVEELLSHPRLTLGAAIVSSASKALGKVVERAGEGSDPSEKAPPILYTSDFSALRGNAGVIDFSSSTASVAVARACADIGIPLLVATTGLTSEQLLEIKEAAKRIPIGVTPNTSVGAAVLGMIAQQAHRLLGSDFDVELMEIHHKMKRDAPSGTAKSLVQALLESCPGDPKTPVFGRSGERSTNEIGVASLRGGGVPGDHTIYFFGESERLELFHKVNDRRVFARGALSFLERLLDKSSGEYAASDLLA
jgi:4-hydroxy-tetrahydrodipicolinate reductase